MKVKTAVEIAPLALEAVLSEYDPSPSLAAVIKAVAKPKFHMYNDMVLVMRHDAIEETDSDVEKAYKEQANVISNKATVIAVCPSEEEIQVGDTIIFSEHAANDIELDGEKYLLLNRRQVYMGI